MNEQDLLMKYYRCKNDEYIKKNGDKNINIEANLIPLEQINYNMRQGFMYTRVSTTMQVDTGFSLDQQDSQLTQYCDAHNIQIVGKFCDEGISGYSRDNRPQLKAMINA